MFAGADGRQATDSVPAMESEGSAVGYMIDDIHLSKASRIQVLFPSAMHMHAGIGSVLSECIQSSYFQITIRTPAFGNETLLSQDLFEPGGVPTSVGYAESGQKIG